MKNILEEIAESIADERARWIDGVIKNAVPQWKLDLLLKYNNWLMRKLLNVEVEIIYETLIADFGTQIRIVLNKKIIGERKFKVKM